MIRKRCSAESIARAQRRRSVTMQSNAMTEEDREKQEKVQARRQKSKLASKSRASTKKASNWNIRSYTKKDVMTVISQFQALDDDMTGHIDAKEFFALPQFQGLGQAKIDALFQAVDKDGDGQVGQTELLRVMFPKASASELNSMVALAHRTMYRRKPKAVKKNLTDEQRKEIETIFHMYDTDDSHSEPYRASGGIGSKAGACYDGGGNR